MTDPTARRAYAPFLAALWSFDRSCRGKGGQTITTNTCTVCHQDYVSGSTAGGALCDPCLATLRGLLEAVKEDPTSRRAAMAEAIKAKDQELHNRPAWDAAGRWLELATAADEARDRFEEEQTK